MTGLFSLTYGNIAVSALIVCGIAALFGLAGRVVWYRVKVALDDHFYPPRPELHQYRVRLDEYADHARLADEVDLPGDREHSWPHEVIPPVDGYPPSLAPDLDEDEHPTDPSGRHAEGDGRVSVDQVTGYVRLSAVIPAPVDDTEALAVVASVSGEDGAG